MTSKSKMGSFLFSEIEGEKLFIAILADFDMGFGIRHGSDGGDRPKFTAHGSAAAHI